MNPGGKHSLITLSDSEKDVIEFTVQTVQEVWWKRGMFLIRHYFQVTDTNLVTGYFHQILSTLCSDESV
jgi:hypothetical protein